MQEDERLLVGKCFADAYLDQVVLHRVCVDARVVEHLVDEPKQVPLVLLDARKIGPLRRGNRAADPQLQ